MPIQCIALDLDRTTLDGEGRLSRETAGLWNTPSPKVSTS